MEVGGGPRAVGIDERVDLVGDQQNLAPIEQQLPNRSGQASRERHVRVLERGRAMGITRRRQNGFSARIDRVERWRIALKARDDT